VHRFAVASWSSSIYDEELAWLKDLYISRGYPPATVIQWIKGSKDIAFKNRLDWVTNLSTVGESERIWPLKSVMNPVWQKLHLGMVSESMRSEILTLCEEERDAWVVHCRETDMLENSGVDLPFANGVWKWFGRLVASSKRPMNFGDKENKHNRSLLGILGRHSKLALAGRSVDQREEDELLTNLQRYTLEDYGFTVTRQSRDDPFLHREV